MVVKVIGFNFFSEEIMRKIFASIMALATIVGCSEGVDNVMPTTPDANLRYVAMEVELGGEQTRVFDENLKWSWESDDMVVGAQLAGDAVVANTLTLRESGKFGCDEFAITTEEAANFLFAYPAEGFDATTESLVALQEGVWSPASAGFAQGVTVDNVGSVALKHLSAAFEIRVYDESGSSAKQVKSAQLSSESDFVGSWKLDKSALAFTQSLSGKELSLDNLSSSVVVFNVAEGDFEFTLTLTDSDNNTITLPLSQRNFVAGKRTILNVKWKSVSLDGATSWYEQIASGSNDSNLEGGYIYLTNYNAAGGNATVYVDGSAVTVTDNKIKVASGTHTVYAELAGIKTNSYTVTVTGKPSASFTAASSYNNNSGAIIKNNTLTNGNEGRVLTISNISVSIADEDRAYFGTPTVVYGGSTTTSALSKEVAIGAYDCYLKLPLSADSSKFVKYGESKIYVTGVPCEANFLESSYEGWSFSGGIKVVTSNGLNVARVSSNGAVISPEFGKNVSFGITVDLAGQSQNINWDFIGKDKESYGNVYMSAGTKASTGAVTDTYILSTYSALSWASNDCTNYIGAVSGVNVGPSAPCLVCYRERSRYDGYIYKIKVLYTK